MPSLKAIQKGLADVSLDAMLLLSPAAQRYACGYGGSGFVLVGKQAAFCCVSPMERRSAEVSVREMPVLCEEESFPKALSRLCGEQKLQFIGFEETKMTIAELWAYQGENAYRLVPAEELLRRLRLVKTPEEQQKLRKAQRLTEEAYNKILTMLHPGIRESELRAAIAGELLRLGAESLAFPPVAAFGKRSAFPHGLSGDAELHSGELVLLDMGGVWEGYCSDLSRTVCCGIATERQKKSYQAVVAAKTAAEKVLHGAVTGEALNQAAQAALRQWGFSGEMCHSLGHGIGLEQQEAPYLDSAELPAGSVLALEPGLYVPGEYGIRVEDVYIVTENGSIPLSTAPDTLLEVCT